jgi:hypothetical protein
LAILNWFNDLSQPVRFVLALAVVFSLVLLFWLVLRKISGGRVRLGEKNARR